MHSEDTPSPPSLSPSLPSHTHLWKYLSFLFYGNWVRLQQVLSRKKRWKGSKNLRAQARKQLSYGLSLQKTKVFQGCVSLSNAAEVTLTTLPTPLFFLEVSITFQVVVIFSNNTHVITQMVSVSMWLILSTPWPLSSLTSFFNDLFLQPTSLPGSKPSPRPYQQT